MTDGAGESSSAQSSSFLIYASSLGAAPYSGSAGAGTSDFRSWCLDVPGDSHDVGTPLQIYECNSTGAQKFRLNQYISGYFAIQNVESGLCVDVTSAGTEDGTRLQMWECNQTGAQTFINEGNTLVNYNSGKCVDISGAQNADGTAVQIWDCNGTNAQSWSFY